MSEGENLKTDLARALHYKTSGPSSLVQEGRDHISAGWVRGGAMYPVSLKTGFEEQLESTLLISNLQNVSPMCS